MRLDLASVFKPTVLTALALMAVIAMMILPVPSSLLDLGLCISFGLAVLIFTITLFIEEPLDFSAFPTVLLASLMLRLSLNISSTKLIIGQGHTGTGAAGHVIEGFSAFVMGGNIFLGLVVFGILLIVNFVVITKGATRMAEVGARFALDGMPGKQPAIDSDMSAGAITHQEARERREHEQLETTFFGSLDGASKFVKGDAIAGLLITLLNLVMGLVMGAVVHDMPLGVAFETYAILTVGDGLVSQLPAVIISIAAALLLARGGAKGSTDLTVFQQFGRHPAALVTVAFVMASFGLVPGLPLLPFMAAALVLGGCAVYLKRKREREMDEPEADEMPSEPGKAISDVLDLDELHIEFAPDLVGMILDVGTGLNIRITNMRTYIAKVFGVILPEIRLTDQPELQPGEYVIQIHGVEVSRGVIMPDLILAIPNGDADALPDGKAVVDPVYGAPARWLTPDHREEAAMTGATIVTPAEILATHLLETVKGNFARLLTLKSLRQLLDEMTRLSNTQRADANRRLLEELVPDKVPLDSLHSVLRLLLAERVSIRNLPMILEAIAEARLHSTQPDMICEHVRQRLGYQIIAEIKRTDGSVPLIQLAPGWEEHFETYAIDTTLPGGDIALPPDLFKKLADGVETELSRAQDNGIKPALITSSRRRRFVHTVLESRGLRSPVISFEEVDPTVRPALVGTIAA